MKDLMALQDALQKDLAWRKRELSSIKVSATLASDADGHTFRSGHVLACSHWEGFLKKALTLYIEHVFAQKMALKKFEPFVVALAFFKDVKKAGEANYPGSTQHHLALAEVMPSVLDAHPTRATWDIDTEGNPGEKVLEKLIRSTGLDPKLGMQDATWETTKKFINEQLLKDRNAIAHGSGIPIGRTDLVERVDRLLKILDAVNDEVMACATQKRYVRP